MFMMTCLTFVVALQPAVSLVHPLSFQTQPDISVLHQPQGTERLDLVCSFCFSDHSYDVTGLIVFIHAN